MKYLKPLSAVLLGRCGNNIWRTQTEDYTTTVAGTLVNENGTDEQLCGIYVTRSQLEQIRNEIDNYLQKTGEGKPKLGIADSQQKPEATAVTFNVMNVTKEDPTLHKETPREMIARNFQEVTEKQRSQSNAVEQKQRLKINPKLVKIEQKQETDSESYRASINKWCDPNDLGKGSICLYASGCSEKEARVNLNLTLDKLIQAIVQNEFILDNSLGKHQKAEVNLESLLAKITPENTHEETDWGKAVGQEIWWSDEDDVILI